MYIHFDLPCDRQTQKRLHQAFRHKIKEWKKLGVINRAVLTYHYSYPVKPTDSLYVCLDISTVKETTTQKLELSQQKLEQIPSLIMQFINGICHDNQIKLRITNFNLEIEHAKMSKEKKGENYYDGAPVEEVLRFASVGTKIAFEVLDHLEENERFWKSDMELSRFILLRLKDELGADYEWMDWALHFVCNPLRIPENLIVYPRLRQAIETIKIDL